MQRIYKNKLLVISKMGKLALFKFAYFVSIILTFILTVVSILGAFAGNVHPRLNMFMTSIGLALPILLIINAIIFFYWIIRRKIWFILPLFAIVANFNFISATIQWNNSNEIPEGHVVKVMSFNARGFIDDDQEDAVDEIKNFIEENRINVVCFQEYRDYVNGRPERVGKFLENLFPYQVMTNNVATFSKFPIIKKDYITFRESNNCAQWIDIELERNKHVRIFNVHMQTTGVNSTLRQTAKMERKGIHIDKGTQVEMVANRMGHEYIRRAEQADIISDIIKETNFATVLCGDFNDTPASYTYQKLKGKLNDGFKTAGHGYMYTYRGVKGLMRIDYILHSQELKGVDYYSPNYRWSDHNPVIMEMVFPKN